jgi:hypothetical protein
MTRTRLPGNFLTSCQTEDNLDSISASSIKRAEDPTNGC